MTELQQRWYSNILSKNIDVLNAMGSNRTRMLNILMQVSHRCDVASWCSAMKSSKMIFEAACARASSRLNYRLSLKSSEALESSE